MEAPPAALRREPLLTRQFGLVFGANFLHSLAFNFFLHMPGFLKALGASEAEIGLLYSLTPGIAVVVRPLIGRVMDARGRRAVAIAGGVVHVVAICLYVAIHALGPLVYAVRLVHGAGVAMLFVSLFAHAADVVPASRRIEGFAIFGISGLLPVSLGGLLGDALLSRPGYTQLFLAAAAFAAVALLLSLALRDSPRASGEEPSRGFFAALGQRDLASIWAAAFAFAVALASCFAFMKTFVMAVRVGSLGLFFSAYTAAAIALRVALGSLPERLGPKRVLSLAMALLSIGLALLAWPPSALRIAAAGVLCGLGHAYIFPILMGLVVTRARSSERGTALAIFTAFYDGGLLLGGPLLGLLVEGFGYAVMFAVASALVVVGLVSFTALDWRRA